MKSDIFANRLLDVDPRVKFLWLASCAAIYFTNNNILILIITIVAVLFFFLSKAYQTLYMKGLIYMFVFFIIIFALAFLGSRSSTTLLLISITICRWLAIILSSVVFFVITPPFEMIATLRNIRIPEGVVLSLGMGFRFIPVILEENERILLAQKARGLHCGRGIKRIFRLPTIIFALAVPLITEMVGRADDIWIALKMRGYDFGKKRRSLRFKHSLLNLVVLTYSICIICGVIIFR